MQQIQHVFFDLDHTLWDFEKNSALAFKELLVKYKITIDLDAFLNVYSPINFKYWKLYREEKVTKKELRYSRLKDTFSALKISVLDDVINLLSEDYINFLPKFNHLLEGTLEILEYLQPNYNLHIITNGFEEVQTKKLKASNIFHFFDTIITSEAVGVKKPNPKVFEYALQVSGATKETSIMIGDNLEADVLGALQVGIAAMHYQPKQQKDVEKKYILINSLLEIKQYL